MPNGSLALAPLAQQQPVNVSNTVDLTVNLAAYVSAVKPSSPVDGQLWVYEDTTSHIRWEFVYRTADTYWYFIGGPPLTSEVTTTESTASATYAALTTPGPAVVIPFAGDYRVTIEALVSMNATVGDTAFMSYDIGGTGAVDADSGETQAQATANVFQGVVSRSRVKTGLTAVTLTSKYRTSAGTPSFRYRLMTVLPVRVSG